MRLAIATNADTRQFHPDDAPLIEALRARGVEPVACVWDDPGVDWQCWPTVLIRTVWDYFHDPAAFARWLDALDAARSAVLNPVATLRWNADKGYLAELEAAGVPSIATRRIEAGDADSLALALGSGPWIDLVVKPAVSGGAWRTQRFARGVRLGAPALAELAASGPLLVQPYVPEVARDGEWSLLFFGGRYSHAVIKRPATGDFRVQQKHGGQVRLVPADTALVDAAAAALDAAARLGHADLAYARVDGVVVDGTFRLMELEVIEPQLFLALHPPAGALLAEVVLARMNG